MLYFSLLFSVIKNTTWDLSSRQCAPWKPSWLLPTIQKFVLRWRGSEWVHPFSFLKCFGCVLYCTTLTSPVHHFGLVGFQAFRFTVALYRMRHGAMGNLRKVWGLPDTRLCVCRSSNTTQQLGRHKTINRQWLTSMETGKLLNSKEWLTVWLEEKCASGLITPL